MAQHRRGLWIFPSQKGGGGVFDSLLRPTYNRGGPRFTDIPADILGQIIYSTAAITSGTHALIKTIQLPSEIAAAMTEPNAPLPDEIAETFTRNLT